MNGVVIAVLISKGFGFVRDEDGFNRFCHVKDISYRGKPFELMHEGQQVTFDPVNKPPTDKNNGKSCVNVVLL